MTRFFISMSSLQGKGGLNSGYTVARLVTKIIWNFVFNLGLKTSHSINKNAFSEFNTKMNST